MTKGKPVKTTSEEVLTDRIEALKQLIPEAFTEGRVDFARLQAALGEFVDDSPERYSFAWAGKRDAIRLLQMPTRATLTPCLEESVDWDTTRNLFIEGDNLEALKLLLKPYYGQVKLIYIDPPYNTGNDFVYPDNYADPLKPYLQLTGQKDTEGNLLTSNPETGGRYHSAWLSMMYPRLFLAHQLLSEDGVILVSIDDKEIYDLRLMLNEIFGEENFIDTIIWKKRYGGGAKEKYLVSLHEYIVFYAKSKETLDSIYVPLEAESIERYYKDKDEKFNIRGPYRTHPLEATKSMGERKNLVYPITAPDGTEVWPKRQWLWSKERAMKALDNNELAFFKSNGEWSVHTKQYLKDEQGQERPSKAFSIIDNVYTQHGTNEIIDLFGDAQTFAFAKPTGLMKPLLRIATGVNEGDIVLDFFAGSCPIAQAMLELNRADGGNRRFIMVQLPEPTGKKYFPTIADIGKERIRRVIARMKIETEGQLSLQTRDMPEDLGFKVYKLAASNFRGWAGLEQAETEAYAEQMELFNDPLVDGWLAQDVVCEVALKEAGFGLNYKIEKVTAVNGQNVQRVSDPEKDQHFFICLDVRLELAYLKLLGLTPQDLFVCRASALDDETAANLALQCRLKVI
jgi:adenine-specific DNA-methyltransferase